MTGRNHHAMVQGEYDYECRRCGIDYSDALRFSDYEFCEFSDSHIPVVTRDQRHWLERLVLKLIGA